MIHVHSKNLFAFYLNHSVCVALTSVSPRCNRGTLSGWNRNISYAGLPGKKHTVSLISYVAMQPAGRARLTVEQQPNNNHHSLATPLDSMYAELAVSHKSQMCFDCDFPVRKWGEHTNMCQEMLLKVMFSSSSSSSSSSLFTVLKLKNHTQMAIRFPHR